MSAYSDARNARARAEGFSSYSQKYRAEQRGLAGKAPEYQAQVELRRTGGAAGIVKRAASGKLLGLAGTQAGTVMAADLTNPSQAAELKRELARYRGDRHVRVAVTMADGTVVNVGNKGGLKLDYLRGKLHAAPAHDDGPPDRPRRADYDDLDEYEDALADWEAEYDNWRDEYYDSDPYGWDDVADGGGYGEGHGGAVSVTVTVA